MIQFLLRLTPYIVVGLIFLLAGWIINRNLRTGSHCGDESQDYSGSCHGCTVSSCAGRKEDNRPHKEE